MPQTDTPLTPDLLIRTDRFIYVIELKVDSSAEEALRQIGEKGYAKPFASDSRRLYRIGVNFSTSTRRIEEWKICCCRKSRHGKVEKD